MGDEETVRRIDRYRLLAGGLFVGLAALFLAVIPFALWAAIRGWTIGGLGSLAIVGQIVLGSILGFTAARMGLTSLALVVVGAASVGQGELDVWRQDRIAIPFSDVLRLYVVDDQFMLSAALRSFPEFEPEPAVAISVRGRLLRPAILLVGEGVRPFVESARAAGLQVDDASDRLGGRA